MDNNSSFVLHFEMQNSGDVANITDRQKEYIGAFKSSDRYRVETDLLSVSILNKYPIADSVQPVKLFKKDKTFKISATNWQDTSQLYIVFLLGSQSNTISNANKSETIGNAVATIKNRWNSFKKVSLKKMQQEQNRAGNEKLDGQQEFEDAIERTVQRNIALSLLGRFSEEDFKEYIKDPAIQEEFSCMNIKESNDIYRDDVMEALKDSCGLYEAGVTEGEIRGDYQIFSN